MAFGGPPSEGSGSISDINVTPLVDVMLVLLVIFMVTAPILQQGVAIDLPKVAAAPLVGRGGAAGRERRQGRAGLPERHRRWRWPSSRPSSRRFARRVPIGRCTCAPTRAVPYGQVMKMMAAVRGVGADEGRPRHRAAVRAFALTTMARAMVMGVSGRRRDPYVSRMLGLSAGLHATVLFVLLVIMPLVKPRPLPLVAYTVELTDSSALGGRLAPGRTGPAAGTAAGSERQRGRRRPKHGRTADEGGADGEIAARAACSGAAEAGRAREGAGAAEATRACREAADAREVPPPKPEPKPEAEEAARAEAGTQARAQGVDRGEEARAAEGRAQAGHETGGGGEDRRRDDQAATAPKAADAKPSTEAKPVGKPGGKPEGAADGGDAYAAAADKWRAKGATGGGGGSAAPTRAAGPMGTPRLRWRRRRTGRRLRVPRLPAARREDGEGASGRTPPCGPGWSRRCASRSPPTAR